MFPPSLALALVHCFVCVFVCMFMCLFMLIFVFVLVFVLVLACGWVGPEHSLCMWVGGRGQRSLSFSKHVLSLFLDLSGR